jgi:hypothetical protein
VVGDAVHLYAETEGVVPEIGLIPGAIPEHQFPAELEVVYAARLQSAPQQTFGPGVASLGQLGDNTP